MLLLSNSWQLWLGPLPQPSPLQQHPSLEGTTLVGFAISSSIVYVTLYKWWDMPKNIFPV